MPIVLYKFLPFFIKTSAGPIIRHTKRVHFRNASLRDHHFLRVKSIALGNNHHRFERWVEHKYLRIHSEYTNKPLNDELAIEKGIETFYELFVYGFVAVVSICEFVLNYLEDKQKQNILNQRIRNVEEQIEVIKQKIKEESGDSPKEAKIVDHRLRCYESFSPQLQIRGVLGEVHLFSVFCGKRC